MTYGYIWVQSFHTLQNCCNRGGNKNVKYMNYVSIFVATVWKCDFHPPVMPPPFATTSNLSLFTAHSGRPRRCCQDHQLLFRQARRLLLCYACQNPLQSLSPSKVERSQFLGPIMKWLPHMCPSQYWWFMRACLGIQCLLPNATQYLTQSPAFPHLRWSHPVLLRLPRLRWFQPVPRCQSAPKSPPCPSAK